MLRKISYIMFGYPRPNAPKKEKAEKKDLPEPEDKRESAGLNAVADEGVKAIPLKLENVSRAGVVIPKPLELTLTDVETSPEAVQTTGKGAIKGTVNKEASIKSAEPKPADNELPKPEVNKEQTEQGKEKGSGGLLADIFTKEEEKEKSPLDLFVASIPDVSIDEVFEKLEQVKRLIYQRKQNQERVRSVPAGTAGTQETSTSRSQQ